VTEPADRPTPGSRWRHVRRGTVYTVLEQSTFQTSRSSRHEQDEFQALLRLAIGPSKDCTGCPRKDARQFCTDCRLATLLRGLDEPAPCKSLDDAPVVTYQGEDGRRWTRPVEEFLDGRFVEVQTATTSSPDSYAIRMAKAIVRDHDCPWASIQNGGTIRYVVDAALVLLAALEESERHIASWKAEEADWAKDREELVEKLNQAETTLDRVRGVAKTLRDGAESARRLAVGGLLGGAGVSATAGSCLALDGATNLLEAALEKTP
jgi:hypothetical protein